MRRALLSARVQLLLRPWRVFVVLAAGLLLFGPASLTRPLVAGATNVSGTISSNTTWTLANSPYVMTGNVTVASGVTLTVEPGVVVQADSSDRELRVKGSLSAVGTAAAPITFTSTADSAPGQWYRIYFERGAGASTLKHVHVRYAGSWIKDAMVYAPGGSLTVEDSVISRGSNVGLKVFGGTSGTDASAVIRRTKAENNAASGIFIFNAHAQIEDSASWSNGGDGIKVWVASGYPAAPSVITGTSVWNNGGTGVQISQDSDVAALGPDGSGNAVYDNGTFGFSGSETWNQLTAGRTSLEMDWRGNYWGDEVRLIPCSIGTQNGHFSYGVPNPGSSGKIERGPVAHELAAEGSTLCANDRVLVNAPLVAQPDLYFDAPPAIFGGLSLAQTRGCDPCDLENPGVAVALDREELSPLEHTSEPVNTASGGLVESATDLQLAGPGVPFAWTRSYNAQDTSSGPLGVGWSHAFGAKITAVDSSTLEYESGSGQLTRFTKFSGGSTGAASYAGKGFDGTMKRLSDDSYELATRDQRVFRFNTSGQLTQIKPRFLPATTLAYSSGKLASITDSAGRTAAIAYSSSNADLIESVTLADGRSVAYGYTGGRLTSVTNARGKTWTHAYDGNGRLVSIQDPTGRYELQNVQYDAQGRVTSEQNGAGATTSYAYSSADGYELTTVTIPGRGSWVYKHRGNMLFSVSDPLGRVSSYTYDGMARKASETDGRGFTRRWEYDAYGNVVRELAPSPLDYAVTRTFNATNDLLSETDGRGNATAYVYATSTDPAADYQVGQLKTVTDREGGISTFKYWTSTSSPAPPATNVGLLKSTSDQRGKTSGYEYDSAGNLTKVTSPLGLKTTFTYDSSGRRTSRRDPRGNVPDPPSGYLTQWAYNQTDQVTTLTDARGNETAYSYYDDGTLWKQTRTDTGNVQRVTTFEYDSAGRLWKSTDPRGGVETRLYWPDGQLRSLESATGRITSYGYDDAGQLTSMVEPNGNVTGATPSDWTWTYGYDAAGNRTSESHPDAGTTTIAYDALNRPHQWTDALNHTTSVQYDANDNLSQRTNALGHSRTYTYDKLDRLTSETDERGKNWTRAYHPTGEPESETTPLGFKTSYGIDDNGRTTAMVEARGNVSGGTPSDYTWAYQYDANGNRSRISDPLGNQLDYEHNPLNDVSKITDQRGNETTFSYDVMNRLQRVTPPAAGASGTLYTEYAYDGAGNLATRTDPRGNTTTWAYDLDGRLTSRVTPVGTWNHSYDANGNLKTLETPTGSSTQTAGDGTISYGYDRMSRLTSVDYSDSTPDVSRTYDLAGRPATMTDGAGGTVSYSHDNADRLTAISRTGASAGLNGSLAYAYDNAGNISSRTYPDGTIAAQTFDDDGRLASVAAGGQTTSFGYDAAGNLTTLTLPSGNGHVASRSFDRAGRLTTVENAKSGTILSKFTWTLDAASNPTKNQTTRAGTETYDAYEYDARHRLTASCYEIAQAATDCAAAANKISYAYDKVSNRTQEVRSGNVGNTGTIDYAYDSADQLTSSTIGGVTTNYSYDANGNQTAAGAKTFTYDLANRLIAATIGGTITTYGHDGDDRRISSTTQSGSDLRYIWDPLAETGLPEVALERTSSATLVRRYFGGPLGAFSMTNGAATFSYHHDPLGSVSDLTDASGSAQWRYEYEVYGATRTVTNVSGNAPENRLRFTGQHLDPETSQYHLRARQYDPATGRFSALDPVDSAIGSPYAGAYVYVGGQPTVLVDPNGEFGWLREKAASLRRELAIARDWALDVGNRAGRSGTDLFSGRTGRRLGASLYDVYASAGGGRRGRIAVALALAHIAVAPPAECLKAITGGNRREISSRCGEAALGVLPGLGTICRIGKAPSHAQRAIGPIGNPGAFPFRGARGLTSKNAAREALGDLSVTAAQEAVARRAIRRATGSSTISVGTYGDRVVIQVRRPGANGYQVIETVIARDGTRSTVQMGFDRSGRLVHYDPKFP